MGKMSLTMIDSKSQEILNKAYTRRLTPDPDGGYTANILEFPGCFAEGETADEALTNLNAAALSWLEVSLAHGRDVRDPVNFDGYSGKVALRIPRGLHQQVAELAELEECSVNQLLINAISQYVARVETVNALERTVRKALQMVLPFRVISVEKWQIGEQSESSFNVLPDDSRRFAHGPIFPMGQTKILPVGMLKHE